MQAAKFVCIFASSIRQTKQRKTIINIKPKNKVMRHKKQLSQFIDRVNEIGTYYICDFSVPPCHFEKWIMIPSHDRKFQMDKEQFEEFTKKTTARFLGFCTYGQGIGVDSL